MTRDEIATARPHLVEASSRGSRRAAIHLFCIECMGGSRREAKACSTCECPLWAYRPGAKAPRGQKPAKEAASV